MNNWENFDLKTHLALYASTSYRREHLNGHIIELAEIAGCWRWRVKVPYKGGKLSPDVVANGAVETLEKAVKVAEMVAYEFGHVKPRDPVDDDYEVRSIG